MKFASRQRLLLLPVAALAQAPPAPSVVPVPAPTRRRPTPLTTRAIQDRHRRPHRRRRRQLGHHLERSRDGGQRARAAGLQLPPDAAGQLAVARTTLNDLIDQEILLQKAKDVKVDVTDAEVASEVDKHIKEVRSHFQTDAAYRTELKNAGFGTPEEYRRSLFDQYRRRITQQRTFAELQKRARPASVTEEEVNAAFEKARAAAAEAARHGHVPSDRRRRRKRRQRPTQGASRKPSRCSSSSARARTSRRSRSANRWIRARRISVATSAGIVAARASFPSSRR